jgi:hypothetical protein
MGPYIVVRFMSKARERSKQQNGKTGRFSAGVRSASARWKNRTGGWGAPGER